MQCTVHCAVSVVEALPVINIIPALSLSFSSQYLPALTTAVACAEAWSEIALNNCEHCSLSSLLWAALSRKIHNMALFTALPAGVQPIQKLLEEVDRYNPASAHKLPFWVEIENALLFSHRWMNRVSFAKVAMGIGSQDGNDHLYCNDCHRGSYYWDHCTAWGEKCLWKPKRAAVLAAAPQTVAQCIAGKRPNTESDFPGAIIWMVQPPRTVTFQHK